jgi:FkbM family methyltransferase
MAIGQSSLAKSLAQSSIATASFLFATQTTEFLLSAAGAYLGVIRGIGLPLDYDLEVRCAPRCLRSGHDYVVIDAGANVGEWLTSFRKHVKSKGRIYAFEPQHVAAEKIRDLSLDNCEVLEVALGESSGARMFYTSHPIDSTGSLYERHDSIVESREYSSMEVEAIRLDDFAKQRKIDRIDFMKMDLEGGEFEALKGAAICMRTGVFNAFSFEFGTSNVNSRVFFRDMYHLLTENRYNLFRITPIGRLIQLKTYSEDYECYARTSTYLAKREESQATIS